jgi:hypothetical protein
MTVTPLHPAEPRYPCIEDPRIATTILKDGDAVEIVLSAHREFDRIHRVGNVALRLSLPVLRKVSELHDHKGDLSVVWRKLPTANDIAETHKAWEAECECMSSHFFDGLPLLDGCNPHTPPKTGNLLEGPAVNLSHYADAAAS